MTHPKNKTNNYKTLILITQLTLALLMPWVITNNSHHPVAPDDFAFTANLFD
jgi:hypothetical protein